MMRKTLASQKQFFLFVGLLAMIFLVCPAVVMASIASDIKAGISIERVIAEAYSAGIAPEDIAGQLVDAGIACDKAAAYVAKALPAKAATIAAAVAEKNPKAAADIAAAVTEKNPDASVEIAVAVAQKTPKAAADIAAAVAKKDPESAEVIVAILKEINPDVANEIQDAVDNTSVALNNKDKRSSVECGSYDPICQYCENGRILNKVSAPCNDGDENTQEDMCMGGKCRGRIVTSPTNPGVWISF